MIIININRKLKFITVFVVLIASLSFNVYCYVQNTELANKYESLTSIVNRFDKARLISFVASTNTSVERYESVEIFDIVKGEVIKTVQSNAAIEREVQSYLNNITGMYVKVNAFPEKGYIIRVPLESDEKQKSHWLNDSGISSVNEVFILFPEQGEPYLLVLDEQGRPLFYNFKGSTAKLLKELDFKIGG